MNRVSYDEALAHRLAALEVASASPSMPTRSALRDAVIQATYIEHLRRAPQGIHPCVLG